MEGCLHPHHLHHCLITSFRHCNFLFHHYLPLIHFNNHSIFYHHRLHCPRLLYHHCRCQDQDQDYQQLKLNLLRAQQDELKQFIPKRISYHCSFKKYTCSYLPSFWLAEIDRLDLLSNKNAKYLLYKFNDWIKSMGAEKILIRHTSKVRDEISLQKIEEKDKHFLIKSYC